MVYGTFIEAQGEFARQIDFLSKALGNGYLAGTKYIHVEESEKGFAGVATDGQRLHIADPLACPVGAGFSPGPWRVFKAGGKTAWIARVEDKDEQAFVPWKRHVPQGEADYTARFHGIFLKNKGGRETLNGVIRFTEFIRGFPEATVLKPWYLADLGTRDEWEVSYRGNNKALLFEAGNLKAVIMPLYGTYN